MLHVRTWKWGNKYKPEDVRKVAAGLRRHMSELYRFKVVTDDTNGLDDIETEPIPDPELTVPLGCFARLRMFDPEWQMSSGILAGDRVVCIDLDLVITGPLYPLFYRPETFLILQGANSSNPCPYNGSVWMLRAGHRPDVWRDFSLEAAAKVPYFEFPDDQGWFAHKIPGAIGWKVGSRSGIYAFQKPGWPKGFDLPKDARLVVFPGWRSPEQFKHLPWIKHHWRG